MASRVFLICIFVFRPLPEENRSASEDAVIQERTNTEGEDVLKEE